MPKSRDFTAHPNWENFLIFSHEDHTGSLSQSCRISTSTAILCVYDKLYHLALSSTVLRITSGMFLYHNLFLLELLRNVRRWQELCNWQHKIWTRLHHLSLGNQGECTLTYRHLLLIPVMMTMSLTKGLLCSRHCPGVAVNMHPFAYSKLHRLDVLAHRTDNIRDGGLCS